MSYLKDHLKSIGIIILILVSIIIIILPFYIYSKQFGEFDLSKDQEVFGVFVDYFGGVFNIFNFFATIFLAIIISQFDKNRNKENLDLQKNLFERSLKEIAYKEFKLLEYEFYGLSRAAPNYIINLNTKLKKSIYF